MVHECYRKCWEQLTIWVVIMKLFSYILLVFLGESVAPWCITMWTTVETPKNFCMCLSFVLLLSLHSTASLNCPGIWSVNCWRQWVGGRQGPVAMQCVCVTMPIHCTWIHHWLGPAVQSGLMRRGLTHRNLVDNTLSSAVLLCYSSTDVYIHAYIFHIHHFTCKHVVTW